jgi:hypothetical protein
MLSLSPKTEQMRDELIKKHGETFFNDLVQIQEDGTFLDRDLCICGLIDLYKQYQDKKMTNEQFDIIADFAEWLEYLFGVCIGRVINNKYKGDV